MSDVLTLTFRDWLLVQLGRDDAVGDLARDVAADPAAWGRSCHDLYRHLVARSAAPAVFDALYQADDDFHRIFEYGPLPPGMLPLKPWDGEVPQ